MTRGELEALLRCPNGPTACAAQEHPHHHDGHLVRFEDPVSLLLRALASELLEVRAVLAEMHQASDALYFPDGGQREATTNEQWRRYDRAEVALDALAARIAREDAPAQVER